MADSSAGGVAAGVLDRLYERLAVRCQHGALRAVALAITVDGMPADHRVAGWIGERQNSDHVTLRSRFLVASLTKPVTAAAMLRLVEDGEVRLTTPVASVLPQFTGDGRDAIQLRHLLTHTSGLPDMVPDNALLRERHAGLPDFFESLCRTSLLYEPGTAIGYQSMGSLVMAMIVERLSGMPFRSFVSHEILSPAGMTDSHLGLPEGDDGRHDVQVALPEGQCGTNWHWNSRYWRTLGAPWGGLITTATDLAAFLHVFLHEGRAPGGRRVLAPATAAAMCRDWTHRLRADFPTMGLGWLIRGGVHPAAAATSRQDRADLHDRAHVVTSPDYVYDREFFGDLMSDAAFGHTGATGCAMWADPILRIGAVVLTNTPVVLSDGTMPMIANMAASIAGR